MPSRTAPDARTDGTLASECARSHVQAPITIETSREKRMQNRRELGRESSRVCASGISVWLIARYLSRVWKYRLSREAVKAGWTCISFFLSLPISGQLSREHCKRLVDYVLLYLLVDYKLDDPTVSDGDKRSLLLSLLIPDESTPPELARLHSRLVTTPEQASIFTGVTLTTAESFLIQYDDQASPDELFAICVNKGGQATLAGYRLIYGDSARSVSDEQLLLLGACIQLLDDLADCSKDRRDGIATVATWCLSSHSYLDQLAIVLGAMVLELGESLALHRRWLLELLLHTVRRSKHYSPRFRERLGLARYKRS